MYIKHLAQCLALIKASIDVRHYNYFVYVASKCSYISQPRKAELHFLIIRNSGEHLEGIRKTKSRLSLTNEH